MEIRPRFRRSAASRMAFFAALVFATALTAAPGARASVIEVTHLDDDTNPANGTCTLREAIRAANGNVAVDACPAGQSSVRDDILVRPGVHHVDLSSGAGEDFAVSGDLDLRGPVRIRGASARHSIIDGSGAGTIDRLFHVHDVADEVVFERVTLRGGQATDGTKRGGVLWNLETGANGVTLFEVEVADGRAGSGGGIFNEGRLSLRRSRVVDNATTIAGGATSHGGGIASAGVLAALRIEDSTIVGNEALADGGGIRVESGVFSADRSQVTDNVAGGSGGGLAVESNGYLVQYVDFSRNRAALGGGVHLAEQGEIQRCAFVANEATIRGGGLHDVFGGFARFSTFAENVAPIGAGVYADSTQTLLDSDTIARNVGAGVHNQSGVFMENTLLAENGGGNCVGTPPAFGAFNLEQGASCGFGPTPTGPNFPNTDPLLGSLAENGGPTRTIALLPGSPAIDVVTSAIRTNCQNMLDQRGHPRGRPRTQDGLGEDVFLCDIGAYEATPPFVVDSLLDGADADPTDDVCATAGATCTLRAAIQQANAIPGMNEIVLGPGTHALSIPGAGENVAATGDLDVRPPLTLRGAGVGLTTIDGAGLDRVFEVGDPPLEIEPAPTTSFLRDLSITGGDAGSQNGGGIAVRSPLRIERVRIHANDAFRGSAMSSTTSGSFFGSAFVPIEIVESTIENNPGGGALFLADAALERSSLIDNVADGGFNGGGGEFLRVRLENSTVSGNHSASTGAFFASSAIVESSTIYANTADAGFDPGGVFLLELSVFRDSVIAGNRAGNVLQNCAANPDGIFSLGHNLSDGNGLDCLLDDPTDQLATDPLLAALASNGGPTRTHLPLTGSPAIDQGDMSACPTTDQRGVPRPLDGDGNGSALCDVGAVEVPEPPFFAALGSAALALAMRARRCRSVVRRRLVSPRDALAGTDRDVAGHPSIASART
ncbi:MAG: CSLREA domain-containing protein [Myxococcota bacterium]